MNKFAEKYFKFLIFTVAIVITSLVYAVALFHTNSAFYAAVDDKNNAISVERMINLSSEMVKDYDIILKNTHRLADFIRENPNATNDKIGVFISKTLMPRDLSSFFNRKNTDFVASYVIAPDDIISMTYSNLPGNSNPDLSHFLDASSDYYLNLAKNNPGDVVVQGPLPSVHSHDVLIFNREAIYINGKYWGYVGLTADFYKFLECVRLAVEDEHFVYAIRSSVFNGASDFVWGDNTLLSDRTVGGRQKSIFFGKQRWDLALRVKVTESAKSALNNLHLIIGILYVITLFVVIIMCNYLCRLRSVKCIDLLTNTYNHEYFCSIIQRELKNKQEHALIVMDINYFKQINIVYGHHTGDELLTETTRRLRSVIGYNDKICRIGAEFIIFLSNVKSRTEVERVYGEIVTVMSNNIEAKNFSIKPSIVMGSSSTIEEGRDMRELFHKLNDNLEANRKAQKGG